MYIAFIVGSYVYPTREEGQMAAVIADVMDIPTNITWAKQHTNPARQFEGEAVTNWFNLRLQSLCTLPGKASCQILASEIDLATTHTHTPQCTIQRWFFLEISHSHFLLQHLLALIKNVVKFYRMSLQPMAGLPESPACIHVHVYKIHKKGNANRPLTAM